MSNSIIIGSKYENIAANFLEKNNIKIIEKNFYCKLGEIDLIAIDKLIETLIFIEVRYRKKNNLITAAESINFQKQQKIIKTAKFYMQKNKFTENFYIRFDVIAIDGEKISWLKNVF